ncbi:hypothetical protein [Geobacter sp. OR-1]|uniref:hypothetical protein n=1 Tax=Geobacter sp. OR-1 TaxID=1266765 RepID=UPI0009DCC72A|nr:hypothetical protein [Geobacter sp. OR-1]
MARNTTSFFTTSIGLPVLVTQLKGSPPQLPRQAHNNSAASARATAEQVRDKRYISVVPSTWLDTRKNRRMPGKMEVLARKLPAVSADNRIETPLETRKSATGRISGIDVNCFAWRCDTAAAAEQKANADRNGSNVKVYGRVNPVR